MKKVLLFCVIAAGIILAACKEDVNSVYSTKYRVACGFDPVVQYQPIFDVVGSYGQFATVRLAPGARSVIMSSESNPNREFNDKIIMNCQFGLGGLIIGTTNTGKIVAYDLACPNCDRQEYRLTLKAENIQWYCKCAHCGIVYNMDSDGIPVTVPEGCVHQSPRPQLQYRTLYDGTRLTVYN